MIEKKALIKGIKSNFKVSGEGKPLLILHGWGGSSDAWSAVRKRLSIQGFKVYSPDLPGFGKTDMPSVAWTISDYVDWTLDFIDYLKLDKFYLVSHSFGGRLVLKLAVSHPKKIEKMVLCSPAGIKMDPDLKTRSVTVAAEVGNAVFSTKILKIFRNVARSIFYLFLRHRDYVKASGPMRETMKKILAEDLSSYLPKIKIKTLIIWGRDDKMVPVKLSYIFHKNIKNSQLEIIPKIGHSPHLGMPDKLSQLITQFFKAS